jgi:peptidoglycan-associated lipoprotein
MLSRAIHPIRLALFAGAILAAACAGQQKRNDSTEVHDASVATAPVPPRAEPAAPQCRADSDCAAGQACSSGQCVAAPRCDFLRVSFAFDSAQLDERATQSLRDDAQCLKQRRAAALLIEGHCDERGTTAYNIALGARRAEAVKRYLAELGVTARIETVSFGKELPAVQGTGEAAWAKNRRAELKATGDTRSDGKPVAL